MGLEKNNRFFRKLLTDGNVTGDELVNFWLRQDLLICVLIRKVTLASKLPKLLIWKFKVHEKQPE